MNIDVSKPWTRWVLAAIGSAAGVIALSYYLQWPTEVTHRFVLVAAAALLAVPSAKLLAGGERRLVAGSYMAGFLFTLAQVVGERLSNVGTLALAGHIGRDLALLTVCTLCLAPAAGGAFLWLCERVRASWASPLRAAKPPRYRRITVTLFSAAVLVVCWLPYLLAFYPGLFTYDISYQYLMYTTGNFSTHHPLLHTLMVGLFCDVGRVLFGFPVKGFLLYTLVQMALLALAMGSAISFLYRRGTPLWFCILLLVLDAVLPFNTLLAISSTKDTLFAASVLYLMVVLLELLAQPALLRKPGWMLRFVLVEIAVGLMRNNGFICLLAVLAVSAVGLIHYRRQALRMIALCLCGIALYMAGGAALKAAVHATDGPFAETLSVPIQQLSRAYTVTDDEAKAEILQWLPDAAHYAPSISDMVKNTATVTREQLAPFLRLWLEVGLRHPIVYLDAFGLTTKGFFQLDETPPMGGQYLETAFHDNVLDMMLPNSQWPWLRDLMAKLYSYRGYLDVPLLAGVLSHAFWCWGMLLTFLGGVCLRRRDVVAVGAVPVALYLSVLLGPCVMLRYIYPIMLAGPLLLGALLARPQRPLPQASDTAAVAAAAPEGKTEV